MPKVIIGLNDLASTHPHLIKDVDGWNPKIVGEKDKNKYNWKCDKGHKWSASIRSRTCLKTGCPVCANKKILVGFNDFATTHPHLAKYADGWDTTKVFAGSKNKYNWKCDKGHKWMARIASPTYDKKGCPVCDNKQVLFGYNDLFTSNPELAKQAHGWDAKQILAASHKKMDWKCENNHVWQATVLDRNLKKTNCPVCVTSGFNPKKDSFVYLLEKDELLKIGICNQNSRRFKTHKSNGWEVIDKYGPILGFVARKIEKSILMSLDLANICRGKIIFENAFDGYTESWLKKDFFVSSIEELCKVLNIDLLFCADIIKV